MWLFQAVDEVSRGQIKPSDKLYELKALQESGKMTEVGQHKNWLSYKVEIANT